MRITSQKGFSGINETAQFQDGLNTAVGMSNFQVTNSGSLAKRKSICEVCGIDAENIDGIWSGTLNSEELVVFAAGGKLYRIEAHTIPAKPIYIADIKTGNCLMFEFNGLLYVKIGSYYCKYDGITLSTVEGYVPLIALSCKPSGEGELFEQINLICDKRRQQFSGDGVSVDYYVAEKDIDIVVSVKIDGVLYSTGFSMGKTKDHIHFDTAPPEGLNNVEITYIKWSDKSGKHRIFGCTKVMLFGGNSDGRAFLWGNPDYPNYRFHSDLADGIPSVEYFPVNAFTVIGNNKINCIVQQYDRQLIFAENEAFYSYCELRDDGLGNTYSSFPVYSLNGGKGCLIETEGCVIDNRPVTLCSDGLNMWESTSVPDEKNAVCFSMPIDISIRQIINGDKSEFRLFDFQANRELYFICDDTAYIYNYGNGAWYVYSQFGGDNHTICGTVLYFSRGNTVYAFGNDIGDGNGHGCSWKSAFLTNGQNSGRTDIVGFEADMYIEGPITLNFDFEKSGDGSGSVRTLHFGENEKGFRRISFRPSLKRAMPFRLTVTQTGEGHINLHAMSIKTRERERSSRLGIL